MKKILLLPSLFMAFVLSSCNKDDDVSGWVALSSINSTLASTGESSTVSFIYATYDSEGLEEVVYDGKSSSRPYLYQQSMNSGDIELIQYLYSADKDTLTVSYMAMGESEFSSENIFKLGSHSMASEVVSLGDSTLYEDITYDSNGFRATYEDYTLTNSSKRYTQATNDDKVVATYTYSVYSNKMSLQQYAVPGSPLQHYSGNFGYQSDRLLSSVNAVEDGAYVSYEFSYIFNINNYVAEEFVYRNGVLYMTNAYVYSFIISD